MNGRLNMMKQIDHCITDHNLFISEQRMIHYLACHSGCVIARDNSPVALADGSQHHAKLPVAKGSGEGSPKSLKLG